MTEVTIKNQTTLNQIPTPRESVQQLLAAARVEIPLALPYSGTKVYTRKNCPKNANVINCNTLRAWTSLYLTAKIRNK